MADRRKRIACAIGCVGIISLAVGRRLLDDSTAGPDIDDCAVAAEARRPGQDEVLITIGGDS